MTFLYTAHGTYDKTYDEDGMPWDKYIEWSKLTQLTELVSLDGILSQLTSAYCYFAQKDSAIKYLRLTDKIDRNAINPEVRTLLKQK